MIRIAIDKAQSLIHDKSEVNIANELVHRIDTLSVDRTKRLDSALFSYNYTDLMDRDLDYYNKDEIEDTVMDLTEIAQKSMTNYFESLANLSELILRQTDTH